MLYFSDYCVSSTPLASRMEKELTKLSKIADLSKRATLQTAYQPPKSRKVSLLLHYFTPLHRPLSTAKWSFL